MADTESTYMQHVAKLKREFRELVSADGAGPETFESVLFQLLKSFETVRLKSERDIKELEEQIRALRYAQKNAEVFSKMLVGMVAKRTQEHLAGQEPEAVDPNARPIDTEVLKTICVCGCQDEEDAADCECSCHRGVPCDSEKCVVCAAKKLEAETASPKASKSETSGRRRRGSKPATKKKSKAK
jgi:hypothetical protein